MSLYADYIREREGASTIETDWGFVVFEIDRDELYICDLYVRPENRGHGNAKKLLIQVLEVAKGAGCKYILGAININSNTASKVMMAMLHLGAKMLRSEANLLYLIYPIEGNNG